MANKVTEVARIETNDRIRRLLTAELDGIADRLHRGAAAPIAEVGRGNFLDLAQGLEHQEQEHLVASRLMEQAKRLHVREGAINIGHYPIKAKQLDDLAKQTQSGYLLLIGPRRQDPTMPVLPARLALPPDLTCGPTGQPEVAP